MLEKAFRQREEYRGPVLAVILDWAGTAVDHGCLGPAAVFKRAFEHFGLEPTLAEIRQPMGMEKRAHCRAMLDMPRLNDLWRQKHGLPDDSAVDSVFAIVRDLMPQTLADYAEPVPGCLDAIAALRARGIKIGSCTGYSRPMMVEMLPASQRMGYAPDCLVTADEAPAGRPAPWMVWLNMMRLGVFPPEAVVKVGDTVADIREGINAGCWSVGVCRSSNGIGLTAQEAALLDPEELQKQEARIRNEFWVAGAHYVISQISELPALCDEISRRMEQGRY